MEKDALRFLNNSNTAVISTCYRSLPHISTVYFVVDEKFNFFFMTKENTDKYINLSINNNVALVVGTGPKHISIQARGHAEVTKGKEKDWALQQLALLRKKLKLKVWPVRDLKNVQSKGPKTNGEVVYKIIPQHLTFLNLDHGSYRRSLSDKSHTIIPGNAL